MKAKLGKLPLIAKTAYTGYKVLLKKSILGILKTEEQESSYVLLAGEYLDWKCGAKDPTKPLLFLDSNIATLKKEIKTNKALASNLKAFSYGTCKLEQEGEKVTVKLYPQKGKLTQPATLKGIAKVLKKFKPKVFLELGKEEAEGTPAPENKTTTSVSTIARKIGTAMVKLHQEAQATKNVLTKLRKDSPNYPKVRAKYNQIIKQIKSLCQAWNTQVKKQIKEDTTIKDVWTQVYDYWVAFFKKKGIQIGAASNTDQPTTEKLVYEAALADLEAFNALLDQEEDLDLKQVEKGIKNLEQHLQKWLKVAPPQDSKYQSEQEALQEIINNLQQELQEAQWVNSLSKEEIERAQIEGKYYQAAQQALEQFVKDMDNFDVTNPTKIESDIAGLEQHLVDWKGVLNGQPAIYADDLKAMEEALEKITSEWEAIQPKQKAYEAKIKELEQALDSGASEEAINQLLKQAEAIVAG